MTLAATEPLPSASRLIVKEKFQERYSAILKKDYDRFIACSTSYGRKSIRINTIKAPVSLVKTRLEKNWMLEQVPWCPEGFWIEHRGEGDDKRYDIGNTLEHILGYIYVQDAASMIPPAVLAPNSGDIVLDLCAAPGSKTSQIAAMMRNTGVIIANDLQGKRLKALGINLQRTGTINAIVTQMQGSVFHRQNIYFDKVLVDAPCSGTGTLNKSLSNLKLWSPNIVKKFAGEQKRLLLSGFKCLKKGGTLVYSTCTMEPEENEAVVSRLLEECKDACLEDIRLDIKRSPSLSSFGNINFHHSIHKTLRIWPQDNYTEGFFVAKIIRQ
jgi:tRNA (cytosine49-C5)-methyltransferase